MKYTNQEAFDKVVKHLVKQGEPAMSKAGCLYQTPNGMQCAAGCLIPDEKTRLKANGNWGYAIRVIPSLVDIANVDFVNNLQLAHDGAAEHGIESWRTIWVVKMKKLAKEYKLKSDVLKKLATKPWQEGK